MAVPRRAKLAAAMRSHRRRALLLLIVTGFVAIAPSPAHADIPFVFVFLMGRATQWAGLIAGLIIEFIVLLCCFGMPWKRAIAADLAMNAASTVIGMFFPGLAIIYFQLMVLADKALGGSVREAGELVATILLVALGDAVIEAGVLRWAYQISWTWKRAIALFCANAASATAIYASFVFWPVR